MLGRKDTEDRMRKFDYSKLADRTWDNEIISYISKIHEYKGKQELFESLKISAGKPGSTSLKICLRRN